MAKANNYTAKVTFASRELSARDRLFLKDTTDAIKLDAACDEADELIIEPDYYAVIDIHNDKATPTDYENYVVVDKGGNKYVTGSGSFFESFSEIAEEMGDEPYKVHVYKRASKNYAGKGFLTCSIV